MQSRKPYPEFTKVQEIGNVAEAKYNSLAVKLTRRLHNGLSVLGGYTLSKSTDNGSGIRTLNGDTLFPQDSFCLECEWGLSIFDVRHRFVSSVLYELPFGDGKPFLPDRRRRGDPRRLADQHDHLDLERLSEKRTTSAPTGRTPAAARTVRTSSGPGSEAAGRPATIRAVVQHRRVRAAAGRHVGQRRPEHVLRTGHHQRRCVDHPELPDRRSNTLQFRLEAFNALNHPIWNDPNTTLTSPLYGTINSTRKPMRELQLGLKFVF